MFPRQSRLSSFFGVVSALAVAVLSSTVIFAPSARAQSWGQEFGVQVELIGSAAREIAGNARQTLAGRAFA
jgi:hypothetical protein